jgi:hypothetical protein
MSLLYLYPLIAILMRLSKEERYSWTACLGAGLFTGHLITSHGASTLLLGGVLAGFLGAGRFKSAHELASVALVFLMVIYYGGYPVPRLPFIVIIGAAWVDQAKRLKGQYVLINASLVVFLLTRTLDIWTAVAFLSGEVLYSYPYGGSPIGKKDRRYPGFRRRG